MDVSSLKNCKKSPGGGGMSRKDVDALARKYGINPAGFSKKNDLCDEIFRVAQGYSSTIQTPPVSPSFKSTAVNPISTTGTPTNADIAKALENLENFSNDKEKLFVLELSLMLLALSDNFPRL